VVLAVHAEEYSIMIDAGSTGSRAYIFHTDEKTGSFTVEKGAKLKPGLSSTPVNNVSQYLGSIAQDAKRRIPAPFWKQTTVYLRATGGMRALSLPDQVRPCSPFPAGTAV
jgi:Golgi nucleoside diphosphatase